MSFKDFLQEGKNITIDVDYMCDDEAACKKINKKWKVKVKVTSDSTADVTGTKENLIGWLGDAGYDDIEELYPELA